MTDRKVFGVMEVINEAPDVKTFRFKPRDFKFDFKPGQFVNLHMPDVVRAYSISSSPSSYYIDLTIKMIKGKLTSQLEHLRVGDEVIISGPYGNFAHDSDDIVMIACGIGVTPMMSHLREIADKKLGKKITLLYSAKTEKDMIFEKELNAIQRDIPSVSVVYTITREASAKAQEQKRIDAEMIKKYVENPETKHYLVCGPADVSETILAALAKLGVPTDNIKKEFWG
ncbi:MAG: FAD-binding oxidoreductase [archaeon]